MSIVHRQRDGRSASSVEAPGMAEPQSSEPYPAATVIIAREHAAGIEVFLLRRSRTSAFMPDVFVFPGGRVEPQDGTAPARARLAGTSRSADSSYVYAAARETFEECGLLFVREPLDPYALDAARQRLLTGELTFAAMLEAFDARIDADALHYFSRWITPASETRRFDTHFFVARSPAGQTACADARETYDGIWIAPTDALASFAAGAFALIFPTVKHLERIRPFRSVAALLDYARTKPIAPVMPTPGGERTFAIPVSLEDVW